MFQGIEQGDERDNYDEARLRGRGCQRGTEPYSGTTGAQFNRWDTIYGQRVPNAIYRHVNFMLHVGGQVDLNSA